MVLGDECSHDHCRGGWLMVFCALAMRMYGKLFSLSEDNLARAYFSYFSHYKIVVLVFNLVPYVVLKLLT